ncbi:MAG: UDP-N-acetylmuramate dehydrogenase [bacterium]|nr:UDP-N-acetylmuramate dehydrogenase [bacterium]
MRQESLERIRQILQPSDILLEEPMKKHTTFRAGGNAAVFLTPESEEQLSRVLQTLRERDEEYYILGNGSNLLVSDGGYAGTVIQIYKNMNTIRFADTVMEVSAGVLLSQAASAACEHELTGMEFASGIPGTLGGAIVMNAGAYGGEMKQIVKSVRVLQDNGQILTLGCEEMEFGYRTSLIKQRPYIVLSAELQLIFGEQDQIRARMNELKTQRIEKQPLEYPSAGSTFKRPEGYFAGKLIMDAGLRGYQIGGAQVSEKHCGFIINRQDASASDIMMLIRYVIQEVNRQFGVTLEPEVCMLGEFD